MSTYLPPPTYADVILIDENSKQPKFNPIWLDWFVRLVTDVTAGGVTDHNVLANLQGGTANQYYHLTSALATATAAAFANQSANRIFSGPATGAAAAPAFRALVSADGAVDAWASFATTRTGWTDVGTPTVTSRYTKAGRICFFQIKVIPATTVATVAGTSYCSLPVTAAGLAGDVSMTDLTTLIAVGNAVIDVANSRVYVPAQAATGDTLLIAGWYEV